MRRERGGKVRVPKAPRVVGSDWTSNRIVVDPAAALGPPQPPERLPDVIPVARTASLQPGLGQRAYSGRAPPRRGSLAVVPRIGHRGTRGRRHDADAYEPADYRDTGEWDMDDGYADHPFEQQAAARSVHSGGRPGRGRIHNPVRDRRQLPVAMLQPGQLGPGAGPPGPGHSRIGLGEDEYRSVVYGQIPGLEEVYPSTPQ